MLKNAFCNTNLHSNNNKDAVAMENEKVKVGPPTPLKFRYLPIQTLKIFYDLKANCFGNTFPAPICKYTTIHRYI